MDAAALVWREKLRHQAVRPISAIRHVYKDANVTAWLQNKGKQTFPGREWTSYLRCVAGMAWGTNAMVAAGACSWLCTPCMQACF